MIRRAAADTATTVRGRDGRPRAQAREHSRVWRVPALDGMELFEATYTAHRFERHAHDTAAIGVVDSGVGEFWCRGESHLVPTDSLILIAPGDMHTGGVHLPADSPLVYRMFYPSEALVASLIGHDARELHFRLAAPRDPVLAASLRRLHALLRLSPDDGACGPSFGVLEGESLLSDTLLALLRRHGTRRAGAARGVGREPAAVAVAREYLHTHVAENVSLRTLALLAGDLNPSYFNRAFRAAVGLPPHAYQVHLRVLRAKELLAAGHSISDVAWSTGFADQSHLTRHFKRQVGVTPARYRGQLLE
ncbi:MAG TPA: AraC family transcriptional regulator [Gemmatimonadaceae bacterium]|nr:AraC family transcriptional regulator [Gemmatimonadaceae bacterium]